MANQSLDRSAAEIKDMSSRGRVMLVQANKGPHKSAHVVVVGNEKGGSGKSTTAIHVAIALMKAGQRVATVDLDSRQKSLTRYIDNRRAWAKRGRLDLEIPMNYCVARVEGIRADENEVAEFSAFAETIATLEHNHDFVVIDTPGSDNYLMRLAHAMADTLITPLNDSFVDFDVLGTVDPATYALTGTSHYSEMVRDARRHRRLVDQEATDWIVVRNRLSSLSSRSKRLLAEGLQELGLQLGFRSAEGFAERVVYREFFPRGLTALDDIDESTLGTRPSLSHVTARQEVQVLLTNLRLPIDEKGRRRALARSEWFATLDRPIEVHDLLD
jgi:chromosome partitioning protein